MKNAFKWVRWLDSIGIAIAFILVSLSLYQVFEAKQRSAQVTHASLFVEGKQVAVLEVSEHHTEQARGLMGRSTLPVGKGMLFPVKPPRKVQVWMKDVNFALDIVFIRNEKVVSVVSEAKPCLGQKDCPLYQPNSLVDAVIELPAGQARSLQLQVGTPITWERILITSLPRTS